MITMMNSSDSAVSAVSGDGGNNSLSPSMHCHSLTTGPAAHIQTKLPKDYVLGDNDVICGRGSRCFHHIGNQRFRETVEQYLPKYMGTQCRHEKTSIICEVVKFIRQRSPNGGFVKFEKSTNLYYGVGDFLVREKVSQAFRDASEAYKSSNATKKKNRQKNTKRCIVLQKSKSRYFCITCFHEVGCDRCVFGGFHTILYECCRCGIKCVVESV
jgi:hypothetical protein